MPSLDSFLTLPPFDGLSSAASSGTVIIIIRSKWRSDILVLLYSTSPSLIPTSRDFYHRANALKDELQDSRHKSGLNSSLIDETLTPVLEELYELVGKPIIDQSVSCKYQNGPASGSALHPSFVSFLSTPWVESHLIAVKHAI